MTATIRLCKDCAHLRGQKCAKMPETVDYITGEIRGYIYAQFVREYSGYCGPDAKWFEPKEQAQAIAASQKIAAYADVMSKRDRDSNDPANWPEDRK